MLRWKEFPGAQRHEMRVVDRDNHLVWKDSVETQTQVTVPPDQLKQGLVYFWQVQAFVEGEAHVSPAVGFFVLSLKALREVESAERKYKGSALVLASMYEAYGLYEEALSQVERLHQMNPTSLIVEGKLHKLRQRLGKE
jgi:hypothetical protein